VQTSEACAKAKISEINNEASENSDKSSTNACVAASTNTSINNEMAKSNV